MINKDFGMSFSEAIEKLNSGELLSRAGWNGRCMFIWKVQKSKALSENIQDKTLKKIADENGGEVEILPCIRMKTVDNKVVTGWVPTQSDIFATDWFVVI